MKTHIMLKAYGLGPEGKKCKDCDHHILLSHHGKVYQKCKKHGITHGEGTDHLVNWPSCGRFKEVSG